MPWATASSLPLIEWRRYAQENGHRLHAGALIRQVQCVRRGEHNVQTGLMYAPLDGDERQFGTIR